MTKHLSYVIIFSHRNIGPGPDQCHFLDPNPGGSGFGSDPMGSSHQSLFSWLWTTLDLDHSQISYRQLFNGFFQYIFWSSHYSTIQSDIFSIKLFSIVS